MLFTQTPTFRHKAQRDKCSFIFSRILFFTEMQQCTLLHLFQNYGRLLAQGACKYENNDESKKSLEVK